LRFGVRDLEHARSQYGQQHGQRMRPRGLTMLRAPGDAKPTTPTGIGATTCRLVPGRV
jgi:hypothetical protein